MLLAYCCRLVGTVPLATVGCKRLPICSKSLIKCRRFTAGRMIASQKPDENFVENGVNVTKSSEQVIKPASTFHSSQTTSEHFPEVGIDYDYFKNVIATAGKKVSRGNLGVPGSSAVKEGSKELVPQSNTGAEHVTKLSKRLKHLKPQLPVHSESLAPYVNDSLALTRLLELGVDLSKIEKNVEEAQYLVTADFERDLQPYIILLVQRAGVKPEDLGTTITKFPGVFKEDLDDLNIRINYFISKKFEAAAISRITTMCPQLLGKSVTQIDGQLGILQKDFQLTGAEVRTVVTRYPKIVIWNKTSIQMLYHKIDHFLGFSKEDQKQMLLALPKLYMSGSKAVIDRFDYLHNTLGYTHKQILVWPPILRARLRILKDRHLFLKHLGKDQFDATKENYVSPKDLAHGRDVEFCDNVAKVPVQTYNDFLKTL